MTAPDRARLARVALGWYAESGNWQLWRRVSELGPVRVLEGLLARGVEQPLLTEASGSGGLGPPWQPPEHGPTDVWQLAAAAIERAERLGARVVVPDDDEWPGQLDQLHKICVQRRDGKDTIDRDAAPPLCLWVCGGARVDELLERSVAVVGSRAATGYGAHAARQIGYGLGTEGWTVVSGGAFGIDAYAHRGALAAGGCTVAVLATGIDRAYPVGHANLFDRIAEDGMLISEWPLGTDPFRYRFLVRNRLIAALTTGTVLVEAAARSGARQTFRRAGELGRCRMVVPGPVTSAMSVGCHEELRSDPAVRLVTGVPQILEEVGKLGVDLAPVPRGPEQARDRLDPVERRLVEALLKRKPLSSQALAGRARVPFGEATRVLPGLVARGIAVRREHGFVLAAPAESALAAPAESAPAALAGSALAAPADAGSAAGATVSSTPASPLDIAVPGAGPSRDGRAEPGDSRDAAAADAGGGG